MSMSRKNYREFAAMLANRRKYADSIAEHALLDVITNEMASIFYDDNIHFSRSIFNEAAGYNSDAADAARMPITQDAEEALADLRRRAY